MGASRQWDTLNWTAAKLPSLLWILWKILWKFVDSFNNLTAREPSRRARDSAHTHADAGKLLQEEQLEQLSATETEWARMKETVFHVPASCDIVTSICDYEIVMDNSTPHAVNLDDNSSVVQCLIVVDRNWRLMVHEMNDNFHALIFCYLGLHHQHNLPNPHEQLDCQAKILGVSGSQRKASKKWRKIRKSEMDVFKA